MTKPGIYPDLPFADYLAVDAANKSKLWALYNKTPAHCHDAEDEATPEMDWGTALHVAVLEPKRFETAVIRGPKDRRGGKWTEAAEANPTALVLPLQEFDDVCRARDSVMRNARVRALATQDGVSEASGFWIDPETQLLCRMRCDRYVPSLAMMADFKTTTDAGEEAFRRVAERMGYDLHHAMYSEGWTLAGGGAVEDFIFIAVERKAPFCHQMFQYKPAEVQRGRAIMRKALRRYAECKAAGQWPGYDEQIQWLEYKEWTHRDDALRGLYENEEDAA